MFALYTNIGRGHPNYLDGLVRTLASRHNVFVKQSDVFQLSQGAARAAWDLVRLTYVAGGRGGMVRWAYNRIRSRPLSRSWLSSLLSRDLRRSLAGSDATILLDHPVVAQLISDLWPVCYVHGEMAAPPNCIVPGAARVLVPLETTRDRFIAQGQPPESLCVTGLMIEPEIVPGAGESFKIRLKRVEMNKSLTIGFFTSGAYSPQHTAVIVKAAASVFRNGHRTIVFAGYDWCKLQMFARQFRARGIKVHLDLHGSTNPRQDEVTLVYRPDRLSDTLRAAEIVPQLDLFVAAAHERVNWAVGLGLPMLAVMPNIGPFAQENYRFASTQGVAAAIDQESAAGLAGIVERLRDMGRLLQMAKQGFGRYPINGHEQAAQLVFLSGVHRR